MGKLLNEYDWKPSDKAVKAAEPREFKEYKVPQPYLDQLERCRLARSVGASWKPEGAK